MQLYCNSGVFLNEKQCVKNKQNIFDFQSKELDHGAEGETRTLTSCDTGT